MLPPAITCSPFPGDSNAVGATALRDESPQIAVCSNPQMGFHCFAQWMFILSAIPPFTPTVVRVHWIFHAHYKMAGIQYNRTHAIPVKTCIRYPSGEPPSDLIESGNNFAVH